MIKYKKLYCDYWGYGEQDFIPCMVCGSPGVDVHHIKYKSQGGKDEINNLICLCRSHHDQAHFKEEPYLTEKELKEILEFNMKYKI